MFWVCFEGGGAGFGASVGVGASCAKDDVVAFGLTHGNEIGGWRGQEGRWCGGVTGRKNRLGVPEGRPQVWATGGIVRSQKGDKDRRVGERRHPPLRIILCLLTYIVTYTVIYLGTRGLWNSSNPLLVAF